MPWRAVSRVLCFSSYNKLCCALMCKSIAGQWQNCTMLPADCTKRLALHIGASFLTPSPPALDGPTGMGCSANPIAVDLAQRLLRDTPNKIALVVSTENITQNGYNGL